MRSSGIRILVVAALIQSTAFAQFNDPWCAFVKDTNRIRNPDGSTAVQVTSDAQEKDYAIGDVDRDGWVDLVVVRKGHASSNIKAQNQLLMNEGGVLVDRTSVYAVDSTVAGDFGLMTPTCNRDVQLVDVDGDQWLDIVTAVALSDGDPKWLSHPRVYINKGSVGGAWQGFRYDEFRIPQLLTIPGGLAVAPRFVSVSAGDVTGDGFLDLYFTDHDASNGFSEPTANDLNDRLLVNDGSGNFTDSQHTRMSALALTSGFGAAAGMADTNGDGALDVVKNTPNNPPSDIFISYNQPATVGTFGTYQGISPIGASYAIDVGDLNRDGRPDLIAGDDGQDYCRFNLGNDALNRVLWSPKIPYTYLTGIDQGFSGQIRVVDLDGDGWPETIHADVDVEVPACNRACRIFHNRGGPIGGQVLLREEAQSSTPTWRGAVGIAPAELNGTFDVAPLDLDNDGDIDLVFGRCSGTTVFINQSLQPATVVCSGDGSATACPCGNASAVGSGEGCLSSINLGGKLRASGAARISSDELTLLASQVPDGPGLYFQGTDVMNGGAGITHGDGLLCAGGSILRLGVVFAGGNASQYPSTSSDSAVSIQGGTAAGHSRTYQMWYRDSDVSYCSSAVFNLTNAITLTWQN